ncbi:MAG: hypothetical protein MMC33_009457, partial [Icmadophila ericetorum]|nr:hypothetical protein [Icmadophila ericetorum]
MLLPNQARLSNTIPAITSIRVPSRNNHRSSADSKADTREHDQHHARHVRPKESLLQQMEDGKVPKHTVEETAAASTYQKDCRGRYLISLMDRERRRSLLFPHPYTVEFLQRDAEGDATKSCSNPGEK